MGLETLKDPKSAIKVLIILLAIISFGVVTDYKTKCPNTDDGFSIDYSDIPHAAFFVGVYVILFLVESLLLGLYVMAMDWLVSIPVNWWLLELVYSGFWTFLMLIASCLLSDGVSHVENHYKDLNINGCEYTGYKFGCGIGFVTFFVMIAKCWYTFRELRDSGMTSDGSYQPLGGDNDHNEVTVSV
eukprot:m.253865 g.253865  ORF g.253865 m.253865 type:complete len:186 (+) comp19596_c0_seq1:76-633(+)